MKAAAEGNSEEWGPGGFPGHGRGSISKSR